MVQVLFGLGHYIKIIVACVSRDPLSRTAMALIVGFLIVAVILALLGSAAQAWGVDSRDDSVDSNAPQRALR
jgi:preprotein translocase subunit SecG